MPRPVVCYSLPIIAPLCIMFIIKLVGSSATTYATTHACTWKTYTVLGSYNRTSPQRTGKIVNARNLIYGNASIKLPDGCSKRISHPLATARSAIMTRRQVILGSIAGSHIDSHPLNTNHPIMLKWKSPNIGNNYGSKDIIIWQVKCTIFFPTHPAINYYFKQ